MDELNVIDDYVESITHTKDLVPLLVDMIESYMYCFLYEFANEIFYVDGVNIKVNHITIDMYHTKAKSTFNSKMSNEKLKNNKFRTF